MKVGEEYVGITTPFYCHDGKGNYLFHKRSKNCRDEQGRWDTGGGQLDFGLTPEENVLKEVREEYGCRGIIEKSIPPHTIIRTHKGKKTHWIAFPFFIKVKKDEIRINEPEKIDEIGWFKLNNLPKPLHSGFKWTHDHFVRYFK